MDELTVSELETLATEHLAKIGYKLGRSGSAYYVQNKATQMLLMRNVSTQDLRFILKASQTVNARQR